MHHRFSVETMKEKLSHHSNTTEVYIVQREIQHHVDVQFLQHNCPHGVEIWTHPVINVLLLFEPLCYFQNDVAVAPDVLVLEKKSPEIDLVRLGRQFPFL